MERATTQIRIGPADNGRRMTLEEFEEAEEEEGYRYELARGLLEVTIVPKDPHWQIVSNLHDAISISKREHPGLILRYGGGAECRLWIPETSSGRNPDLAVVFRGTPKDARGSQPPSLVAEVVSKRGVERDYQTKREEYLGFGILEYWIVDPMLRQVMVLAREDGPSWSERLVRGGETIPSGLLPEFAGTVDELWIDVEEEENPEENS